MTTTAGPVAQERRAVSAREITITDTTLRDGHQSLWAARMPTAMMLPVARHQERAGSGLVDVLGHTHHVTAVRFLQENPWQRIRALRRIFQRRPMVAGLGGQVFGLFDRAPDDVRHAFLEQLVDCGVSYVRDAHGLLDVESYVANLGYAKQLGVKTIAALVFSESPVHTDELYAARAREIVERTDADWVMIKDSSGLLTPERTATLVSALRAAVGERVLTLHSHCTTGLAGRVYMVGVAHGVDDVHCAIWPLALGSSQPSLATVARNLREEGYRVDVDDLEIERASEYLVREARAHGLPLGKAVEYDHFHYRHQMPGGMLTNLEAQLRDAGLSDRFDDILRETSRVREELGWPTMVTPYSQFVVNQAVLNVIDGDRYATVPDQVKMYALGHYGALLAPVDPNVLDRIVSRGSPAIAAEAGELPAALPRLRQRFPDADEAEALLRFMCAASDVDRMLEREARDPSTRESGRGLISNRTAGLVPLLAKLAEGGDPGDQLVVERPGLRVRVRR
jgi:oxaloacetate decarboxylase alpha subunit